MPDRICKMNREADYSTQKEYCRYEKRIFAISASNGPNQRERKRAEGYTGQMSVSVRI